MEAGGRAGERGGGGIKGFSDRAEKDTTGYRNPKMAEVPTSRLEGIISTPRGQADSNATTDSNETTMLRERRENTHAHRSL